jgi:nitrogen fixation NifU-like protein
MAYSEKVLEHYQHPQNVGSLDKGSSDVGTGLVGAPECFAGNTLVATADGTNAKTLKELYDLNTPIPVWSFNLSKRLFEIKWAQAIYSGEKQVDEILLDDSSTLISTPDHEFLTRPFYRYVKNEKLTSLDSIRPFIRSVSKRGYWRIRDSKNDNQYLEIYKFYHGNPSLAGLNIHHVDENKRNDCLSNLKRLSVGEHRAIHDESIKLRYYQTLSGVEPESIRAALNATNTRAEAADLLGLYTDEFYAFMCRFGIETRRRPSKEEWAEMSSLRMKSNNPYHNFTEEQKNKFAAHTGDENGRWLDISNEELLKLGNTILNKENKLTANLWCAHAKRAGFPQNLSSRFGSFLSFKTQAVEFNHKITGRMSLGVVPTYTMQVEENNNYVVLTKLTKNIHSGIVVKNCGDVMRLQIRVNPQTQVIEDAKFKTFGCGSAIASSSLATEWVKGRSINEALTISNTDIVKELALPPVKIHCSVLAEDAIRAAIADWKKKQEGV